MRWPLPSATATGDWRRLTWRQTREQVGRIAQSLLGLKLTPQAPIVVLSDNAVDHLLLMLAGMHIGRAVCTVSSAYCRLTQDYTKIHGILNTLGPALVYASDAQVYGPALASSGLHAVAVFSQGAEAFPGALHFDSLARTAEGPAVQEALARITPDTHAKYLLTSGSTGHPKVVINTHRMLCANQQMVAQAWRFLEHETPVIVDWLPWSHTFGGNHNLNLVLRNGGTLFIDEGRPAPGLIEKSVAQPARGASPRCTSTCRAASTCCCRSSKQDEAQARRFFERLRMVFYAGAALPQATWERLRGAGAAHPWRGRSGSPRRGARPRPRRRSPVRTGSSNAPACIGLPLPGMELKFVPQRAWAASWSCGCAASASSPVTATRRT